MPAAALVAFVVGVCLLQLQATLPDVRLVAVLAAAGALIIGIGATRGRPDPMTRAVLLMGCIALGFAWAAGRSTVRLADELPFADEGRDVRVEGTIASLPMALERGVRFEFDVEGVLTPATKIPSRVLLGWYAAGLQLPPVRPGERWQFTVRLRRPHGVLNPGGFDLEAWLLERNLRATGYVRTAGDPPQLLAAMHWRPGYAIERSRAALRDRLAPMLASHRYGGVIQALILGDQRAIAATDWTLFNRTGISHLVSISGLHITMIAGLVALLVAALWRRVPTLMSFAAAQSAGVMAGLFTAAGYALIAGWGVPAQRTVLMLAVVATVWVARARIGLATALACAAAIVCVLDPWAVLAPGFWLSFGAVAAIAWVVAGRPMRRDRAGWQRILVTAARVQLAVSLALVPALIVLFHQLPLVSPLANAVAIPVVSWAVTPLALLGGALAAVPPLAWLAQALLGLAHGIFTGLAMLLQALASQTWSTVPIATPPAPLLALAAAGVVWILAPPGWPLRSAGVLALLPMLVWPAARPGPQELWLTALDVGQGSAVLIETVDRVWLYDSGPRHSTDTDAGERVILPYLRHRGLHRLDGLVISHLDGDHSGGAASILRAVQVERVLSSIAAGHPALDGRHDSTRCIAGDRIDSGALVIDVLHPEGDDYARRRTTNAMSCVLRLRLDGVRVLLTGDIGLREEAALVARAPDLAVTWLMAPHHGSRSSSSEALLAATGARWALVQAGYRNRFGHPDAAVAARYRAQGIRLVRTDQRGAVQWRFGPKGRVDVTAWRDLGARYWHNRPTAEPLEPDADEADDADADALPDSPEPFIAG